MRELSLHILDLCENAVTAGARRVEVRISRKNGWTRFTIRDDGAGMDGDILRHATDPFCTTRTTRRIGLGLPLMKERARLCGGDLVLASLPGRGTCVSAFLRHDCIDCPPMGDLTAAMQTLLASGRALSFQYEGEAGAFSLDSRAMQEALGEVPLTAPAVMEWAGEYLNEGFCQADGATALTAGDIFFGGVSTMKSIAELEAIRVKTLDQVNLRREHEGASHVSVGMGTCGIAAGAREVVKAFMAAANAHELLNMTVAQTGCMGRCDLEPMVVVSCPGLEKVTYVKVKPEMVDRIVTEHVMGGKPVDEYIG